MEPPLGTKLGSYLTSFSPGTGAPHIHLSGNRRVTETEPLPKVGLAVVVHLLRPRWPLGTLWARSGHETPPRTVGRRPRYPLTRWFVVSNQADDLSTRMLVLTVLRNGP